MHEFMKEQSRIFPATFFDRLVRRIPVFVAILSLLVFFAVAPFAKTPLPHVSAFIPIYESMLIVSDLITAVLLFGQFTIVRSKALMLLVSAYFFTAIIATAHMLTYPGVFSETGLLGAGPQSTAWLYMFWHAGFPIFVIAYALLKDRKYGTDSVGATRMHTILFMLGAILCAVVGIVILVTTGKHLLPAIMEADHYTPAMLLVVSVTWGFACIALAVLWHRKPHSTIDLWLMTVLCVWVCDVALSAMINGARYDLGFYSGRLYGLLAASLVLLLLLIENSLLHSRLAAAFLEFKRLAATDHLTRTANRRAFDAALTDEWARANFTGAPISLLMIDVDFFKRFNDHYGHAQGDQCLMSVASSLVENALRSRDLVSRYGGEEFVILLPETDVMEAAHVAQRMCDAIAALAIPHANSDVAPHVTISVGAASFISIDDRVPQDLIKAADRALYRAKANGRGRVTVDGTASVA